jgi:hypothetical protein
MAKNNTINCITTGTTLKVRMAEPINSRVRKPSYSVKVTIENEIKKAGKVVIKPGSKAQALITKIKKARRGSGATEIIMRLTRVYVNNRQVDVTSFSIAGKGTTSEPKDVGVTDENKNTVIGKQGAKITTSIPVITKGYDIIISEGTVVYFILKDPILL